MEPNGLGGGIFPSTSSGLLGVENPLKQQQPNLQNQQNPHTLHHSQMVSYATTHHDTDTIIPQPQQTMKHGYPHHYSAKNNKPQTTLSDEDEPGFTAEDSSGDPKRKVSPWHRMKWTDTMVRLLIMAVYYIGDEAGSEGTDKKKATGLMQKKGKWKSVSRGMMEKGYYVSPQQCEDKFNDLNKRYKRVNDILGKGTACRVVENQTLMDTMDLSPKMREEARKLLNSKHLFFREMCAYHNSCGHGGTSNMQQSTEAGTEAHAQQQQQQQQRCFHSSENGVGSLRILKGRSLEEEEEEDVDDDEWEDTSEEEEDDSGEGGSKGHADEDENDVRKRSRKVMQQLSGEVMGVLQDGGKSPWEKKQWMKKRVVMLEEEHISYQMEAFELEKQRLKWARFSSKKGREMERHKLENEGRRLEIDRMVLLLRQKELELLNIQQQHQHSPT